MQLHETDALDALQSRDLLELGMLADTVRRERHPENGVTYALRDAPGHSFEQATREAIKSGGNTEVMLGDVKGIEQLSRETLTSQLGAHRNSFPKITFHHLPIAYLSSADREKVDVLDMLSRLKDAGLRSIGPGRVEDDHRVLAPTDLAPILHAARRLNIEVCMALTIRSGEPIGQRASALAELRSLQEETQAIQAVLVRVQHATTPEARREEEPTAVIYLKTLAVTRLALDNVEHIQTDWSVMGPKVLELALRFGADDAGWVFREQAGPEPSHHGGESELRRIIRDAGFRPVERDALFRQSLLH